MAQDRPRKKPGKRAELAAWLARTQPRQVGETQFEELRRSLVPISENYLRRLLRESGATLAPLVEGVRQGTLDELESSLLALLDEYERGGLDRRAAVRRLVIAAKDHARWAMRRKEMKMAKEEMILWMTTWLENPSVFSQWLALRRARSGTVDRI